MSPNQTAGLIGLAAFLLVENVLRTTLSAPHQLEILMAILDYFPLYGRSRRSAKNMQWLDAKVTNIGQIRE